MKISSETRRGRAALKQDEKQGYRRAGILGWPLHHTLSPVMHHHWLAEHHMAGHYMVMPAPPGEFARFVESAWGLGLSGVNVTVPHKEAAFQIADTKDDAAIRAGAVNLLVFNEDGTCHGRNTDSLGLAESLRENIGTLDNRNVVLLGAGGAARGAVLSLDSLGAGTIHLLNRDAGRARSLAADLATHVKAKILPGGLNDVIAEVDDVALLVNSTSAGMTGQPPLTYDFSFLPKTAAVCDIVYHPLETQLLKDAAARGHKTIDGLGMLMHQAVPSFEAFFGVKPRVTPQLRTLLVQELASRG